MSVLRLSTALIAAFTITLALRQLALGNMLPLTGPFAFFENEPGEGSVLVRGSRAIAAKLKRGNKADDLDSFLRGAGFECAKEFPPAQAGAKSDLGPGDQIQVISDWITYEREHGERPAYRVTCNFRYGLRQNLWQIRFFSTQNGKIEDAVQLAGVL